MGFGPSTLQHVRFYLHPGELLPGQKKNGLMLLHRYVQPTHHTQHIHRDNRVTCTNLWGGQLEAENGDDPVLKCLKVKYQ